MLKLLYLMPGNVGRGSMGVGEVARRREILQRWAGPHTTVEVWDSPQGPLSIECALDEALCVPPLLPLVVQAEQEDFDAVILGCFGDTGLEAARELVSIPVVGPAQSSMHYAAMLGSKFSILTVLDNVVPLIDRLVKVHDMTPRLASIRVIQTAVLDIGSEGERVYQRLVAEGGKAVEQDRADTLVLGCMSLSFQEPILDRLQSELQVPLINPARCALYAAENLCRMKVAHSARAYRRPPKKVPVTAGVEEHG